MGDIISMYEDYNEVKQVEKKSTPSTLSNKTLELYLSEKQWEDLKSALRRKLKRRKKIEMCWRRSRQIGRQLICTRVCARRKMFYGDIDQYIIPTNSEVPSNKIAGKKETKKKDENWAISENYMMKWKLENYAEIKLMNNIEMPEILCYWQFMDSYTNLSFLCNETDNNYSLLPVKKCYNVRLDKLSDLARNFANVTTVSCGKFRMMLVNSTWLNMVINDIRDPCCQRKRLEALKYGDLPYCVVCLFKKDKFVGRDYQSPPRDCVGCRLYKDEKGSDDDLIQWAKHSQLLHLQRETDIKKNEIKSPVSQISEEEIHVQSTHGGDCCTDTEDAHEKRSAEDNTISSKRRKTDPEEPVVTEDSCVTDSNETSSSAGDKSNSSDTYKMDRIEPTYYKKRLNTRENNARSQRSALTSNNQSLVLAKDRSAPPTNDRVKEIAAIREELANKLKPKDEEKEKMLVEYDNKNKGRWVRETVITALSEGEGDPTEAVDIGGNIKETIVSHVKNDNVMLLATLGAISCKDAGKIDDMTVTTVEKSEQRMVGQERLIKKTIIKIEKNEANKSQGTQLTIEDRLRIRPTDRNKFKQLKAASAEDRLAIANRNMLEIKSNESAARLLADRSLSPTNFRRVGMSRCNSPKSPETNSIQSNTSSQSCAKNFNSPTLTSKTKMLYRFKVHRKQPTTVLELFSDQITNYDEISPPLTSCSTENTKERALNNSNNKHLDNHRSNIPRRANTALANSTLNKKRSTSKARPKSVTNASQRRLTPSTRTLPNSPSRNLSTPTNFSNIPVYDQFSNRPPSRKPRHLSPASNVTPQTNLPDNNTDRSIKNKYTLRRNSLTQKSSVRSKIEKSLEFNQNSKYTNLSEPLLGVKSPLRPSSAYQPRSISRPCSPISIANTAEPSIQIKKPENRSIPSRLPQPRVKQPPPVKLRPKVVKTRLQPPDPSVFINPSSQKFKSQNKVKPKVLKDDNSNDWLKNWNQFSAPKAINGHPLKNMTLAEFQAKRRLNDEKVKKEVSKEPPTFVKHSAVAIMSNARCKEENSNTTANAAATISENIQNSQPIGSKTPVINKVKKRRIDIGDVSNFNTELTKPNNNATASQLNQTLQSQSSLTISYTEEKKTVSVFSAEL